MKPHVVVETSKYRVVACMSPNGLRFVLEHVTLNALDERTWNPVTSWWANMPTTSFGDAAPGLFNVMYEIHERGLGAPRAQLGRDDAEILAWLRAQNYGAAVGADDTKQIRAARLLHRLHMHALRAIGDDSGKPGED